MKITKIRCFSKKCLNVFLSNTSVLLKKVTRDNPFQHLDSYQHIKNESVKRFSKKMEKNYASNNVYLVRRINSKSENLEFLPETFSRSSYYFYFITCDKVVENYLT